MGKPKRLSLIPHENELVSGEPDFHDHVMGRGHINLPPAADLTRLPGVKWVSVAGADLRLAKVPVSRPTLSCALVVFGCAFTDIEMMTSLRMSPCCTSHGEVALITDVHFRRPVSLSESETRFSDSWNVSQAGEWVLPGFSRACRSPIVDGEWSGRVEVIWMLRKCHPA
jgi:hypothetical protein